MRPILTGAGRNGTRPTTPDGTYVGDVEIPTLLIPWGMPVPPEFKFEGQLEPHPLFSRSEGIRMTNGSGSERAGKDATKNWKCSHRARVQKKEQNKFGGRRH